MSHRLMHLLPMGLAVVVLLAACSGAAPAPAPEAPAPVITTAAPPSAPTANIAAPENTPTGQATSPAPATEAATDSGFSRTADGLFARGRADALVTIYDYSDFL